MSGEHLSATTRALLKGARADAPGAAAKAKVWSGVSATLGGAAGAGAAGAGAGGFGTSGAGLGAAKMLVAGTLLGGALTVGLAAMLLRIGPAPSPSTTPPSVAAAFAGATVAAPDPPTPTAAPAIDALASGSAGAGANMLPGAQATTGSSAVTSPASAAHAATSVPRHGSSQHGPRPAAASAPLPPRHPSGDDALTREASLVASARAALSGGNAEEALRLVRSARSMPSPQLVPEELTVEAQALRALGKADDARGVDATLHSQYPESALAR